MAKEQPNTAKLLDLYQGTTKIGLLMMTKVEEDGFAAIEQVHCGHRISSRLTHYCFWGRKLSL